MARCLICDKEDDRDKERSFRLVRVVEYSEELDKHKEESITLGQRGDRQGRVLRQVILQGPGEEITGGLCSKCLTKLRRKSFIGIGIALLLIMLFLVLNLLFKGVPLIFLRVGLFLSLIAGLIATLPLLRNKEILISDQFFIKARAMKKEYVIGLQDIDYFFGRKTNHWLMLENTHWEELLSREGEVRILSDV
ncbi:MAG: hypothetical protein PF447_07205 [Spirochaetaceae bacterium]|nr:hypothetical protein [Spirochaetaceae bacterium]